MTPPTGTDRALEEALRRAAGVPSGAPCDPPPAPRRVSRAHAFAAFADVFAERVSDLVEESRARSEEAFWRHRLGRESTSMERTYLLADDEDDLRHDLEVEVDQDCARDFRRALPDLAPGLPYLGLGSTRVVVALSPDEALKVLLDPRKNRQHRAEGDLWRDAPDELAHVLCPVIAEGDAWRVMGRCAPITLNDLGSLFYPSERAMREVIFRVLPKAQAGLLARELLPHNAGLWCGRVVMVDYGGVDW